MSGAAGSSQWMYAFGYDIDQSLRFEDGDSPNLTFQPQQAASSARIGTFSCWFKRGDIKTPVTLFAASLDSGDDKIRIDDHALYVHFNDGNNGVLKTNALLRDPSAWYHIVVGWDTTQGTAANRIKMYINGVYQDSLATSTYPDQNYDVPGFFVNAKEQHIGEDGDGANFWDGYLAEVHALDGQQKQASDFGKTGSYGEWKPIEYSGTYGNNGFYLPFKNDYTVEGFSTVTYKGTATNHYIGGVGFSSDFVWTKSRSTDGKQHILVDKVRGGGKSLMSDANEVENSNANRKLTLGAADGYVIDSNSGHLNESDKTYVSWNWKMGGLADAKVITGVSGGVTTTSEKKFGSASLSMQGGSNSRHYKIDDHPDWDFGTGDFTIELWIRQASNPSAYDGIISFADSSVTSKGFGIGYNSSGYIYFTSHLGDAVSVVAHDAALSNNTFHHIAVSRSSGTTKLFINGTEEDSATDNNSYITTPRNGYGIALGRYYPNVDEKYFHGEFDEIRISDNARYTGSFSVATAAYGTDANTKLLMHCDGAHTGTLFPDSSSAVENTTGTTTSYVSASTTYGQSIVSYTGTGANATVGHGLSAAPEMMIIKRRSSGTQSWFVYHAGLNVNSDSAPQTDAIKLNSDDAAFDDDGAWNDTAPTSSVFTIGSSGGVNQDDGTYIAYVFHSVTGYSKFGSYTGNGNATGPSVTTGFKPAFVMIKNASSNGNLWAMYDNTRSPMNRANEALAANSTDDEADYSVVDFDANGFQIHGTFGFANDNGDNYIYMAFADNREYAYWLDQSGNNNDWTSVNLTESDISLDSPSNSFCTFNPLHAGDKGGLIGVLSEGNLKHYLSGSGTALTMGTIAPTTGKWYCEFAIGDPSASGSDRSAVGIGDVYSVDVDAYGNDKKTIMVSTSADNRVWLTDNVESDNTFPSRSNGDIIQFAWDMDASKFWIGLNNTWYTSNGTKIASSDVPAGNNPTVTDTGMTSVSPLNRWGAGSSITQTHYLNCGQDSSFSTYKIAQGNTDSNGIGDFFFEPPTGFLACCTKNLPEPTVTPSEHFNTVLYTGNGSAQAISGVGFQPDWVWLKRRSGAQNNNIFDSVRGANKLLAANVGDVEGSVSQFLNSFDSDGFTVGSASNVSANGETNVAFNWKAPTSFSNDASSTSVGSIDSTGKINVAAGFAIISYTGTGSAATVAHGLSSTPEMLIVKDRDQDMHWLVYHTGLTNANYFLKMDNTQTQAEDSTKWNGTDPTSSVFSIGTEVGVSESGNKYIAYCFHSVDGYSKVGTYTGNDHANGTFVYCGFKPAYVHIKNPNTDGEGFVYMNNKSDPDNVVGTYLTTYGNTQEQGTTSVTHSRSIDFVSNGFKIRGNSTEINDGVVQIFYAVAERPFKYSHAG